MGQVGLFFVSEATICADAYLMKSKRREARHLRIFWDVLDALQMLSRSYCDDF
jgi:hypothetical protein